MEFKHEALHDSASQIRLVSIQPGGVNDELSVTLQIVSRGAGVGYDALSYVWGDTAFKESISVNGCRFYVTRNLHNALWRLRADIMRTSDHTAGRLWIDALCIDQHHVEERNAQVRAMHDVFRAAQKVWVWLGQDVEEEDRSLYFNPEIWRIQGNPSDYWLPDEDNLDKVYYLLHSMFRWPGSSTRTHGARRSDRAPNPDPCNDIEAWAQLSRLFKRAWFQRLWVVQELVLAKTVYMLWGMKRCIVPWKLFLEATKAIADPKHWATYKFAPEMGIEYVLALEPRAFPKDDILTALYQTRRAQCTDPRDKLFGMLGIYTDDEDCIVDYSDSTETVVTQWACRRIMRTQSLDVLHLCAGPSSGSLKSWAPDLGKPWAEDRNLFFLSRKARPLDLGRSISIQDSMMLQVHRLTIGQIQTLGMTCSVSPTSHSAAGVARDILKAITDWERMFVDTVGLYGGSEATFLQALFRDYVYWTNQDEKENLRQMYKTWRESLRVGTPAVIDQVFEHYVDNEMKKTLFQFTHGCQMFVFNKGSLGVVAANLAVRITDHIVLLHGAHTPFILREGDGGHFQILGPCFVSGYMQEMRYSGLGLYSKDNPTPLLTQTPGETLLI